MRSFLHKLVSPLAATAVVLAAGACDTGPPIPQPPQANDDHFEIRSDGSLTVAGPGLLTNDVGDAMQVGSVNGSVANVGLPTATAESGTVTVQANGAFQYARAAGFTGTDAFSYAVSNAGGSDDANVSIFVTDPWTQLEAMPTAVSRAAGVFWNGRLYMIGGQAEGSGHAGLVQVYDVATAAWTVLPDTMPTPVSNHCVALLGDEAFVPGGFAGAAGVTVTQVLDLASGTWRVEAAAELPEARFAHACSSLGGRIYLFGGGESGTGADTTWLYEPSLPPGSRWVTTLATMPAAIAYGASVTVDDRIFVAGFASPGVPTDSAQVWAYIPGADDWQPYPPLQTARAGAGVWSDGDTLFVGGGGWGVQHATVEAYDLSKGTAGTWVDSDPMNRARRTFGFALDPVTGHLLAAGGYRAGFEGSAEIGRLLAVP